MIKGLFDLFKKTEKATISELKDYDCIKFKLTYRDIIIGYLEAENREWKFYYSDEYKKNQYLNYITGFPKIYKTYINKSLWPFFKIRIPGLNQPQVIKILNNENIDKNNEVELLKKFGKVSISNPYELIVVSEKTDDNMV